MANPKITKEELDVWNADRAAEARGAIGLIRIEWDYSDWERARASMILNVSDTLPAIVTMVTMVGRGEPRVLQDYEFELNEEWFTEGDLHWVGEVAGPREFKEWVHLLWQKAAKEVK